MWRGRLAETGSYLSRGRVALSEAQHTQVLHLMCPLPVSLNPYETAGRLEHEIIRGEVPSGKPESVSDT